MTNKTKPAKHQVSLEDLQEDPEFREFWGEVLKGLRKFSVNEAILGFIHRPKQRVGTIDHINAQSALDMHRLEGSLEIWETLLYLTSEKVQPVQVETSYEGDL
jgi:hypothetical protein